MKYEMLLIRLEPKTKERLLQVAQSQRHSMNSLVLHLIDLKIAEVQGAN